jgi:hypothetical protein
MTPGQQDTSNLVPAVPTVAGGPSPLAAAGPRVVPFRPRAVVAVAARENTSMAEMTLDLQPSIDSLRSLKGDLEAYYWDHPSHDEGRRNERFQISWWIRQVSDRTAALEGIIMQKGRSCLVLHAVSSAEQEALQSAATVLDQWIHEDETFHRVMQTVAAVLAAADRIGLRAAGGIAAADGARSG